MNTLGDLMVSRGGSLNPRAFPDEEFELYSIPAHDRGGPEIVLGSDIGSPKQIVRQGDVMVSKIIPHIRRSRVVDDVSGRRQIASGEWIVFRGPNFDPNYLRHFLISDGFHGQFMNTVAGVGGSLVRARPEQVKGISLPLPSLDEQCRIAEILDHADALRAKRRQVLTHLDALAQSIFHEMFGTEGFVTQPLSSVAEVWDCPHSTPQWTASGKICLRTPNLGRGRWDWMDTRYVDEGQFEARSKGGGARAGDIIISREGTVGIAALVEPGLDVCMGQRLVQVRVNENHLNPAFALEFLLTALHPDRISHVMVGSTARHLNVKDLRALPLPVPPLGIQQEFAARIELLSMKRRPVERAAALAREMSASLQSLMFRS